MCEYNEDYARKYIEQTLRAPYTVYKNNVIADTVEKLGVKQIYDLGGNVSGIMNVDGSLRFQLNQRQISYVGVDLSTAYFRRSFALSLGQGEEDTFEKVDALVGDIRQLPLPTESVEAVVSADVIEHISCPEKALAEMYRILKPHGKAVVV